MKLAITISQCQNEEHTPERDGETEVWGVFTDCILLWVPKIKKEIIKIFSQWQMTCSPPVAEETAVNCSMRLSLSLSEAKRFKRENIMDVMVQ